MRKNLCLIFLLCLYALGSTAQHVTSLSQIKSQKKYLLENANGYGYAVYNPAISDKDVMLGGIVVAHNMGVANELYRTHINPLDANNQWQIAENGNGAYYLYNYGAKQYMSNETTSWNWWGSYASYDSFYFTPTPAEFNVTQLSDDTWAFRLASASNDENQFMCAASHSATPIENWKVSDGGSVWYIREVIEQLVEDITISQSTLTLNTGKTFTLTAKASPATAPGASLIDWSSSDTNVATVNDGEVTTQNPGTCTITAKVTDGSGIHAECIVTVKEPEKEDFGTLRYFTLNDGQLIVIPEKYILERNEKDGVVTLALMGDSTFSFKKDKLASESTTYEGSLPQFESFKFNNKFNDQLHTDAEGVIDHEAGTINLSVACIGKRLTPSFKLPEGAKAYVGTREQISKKTRRRFDKDITYTVAYPKNWIYRIEKVSDEVWSTAPEETEDPWIVEPVTLSADKLSSNWPSENADQQIGNILDGNISTIFHSNWSATNNWNDGSYYGDGTTTWPYLQIEMPEPIENFNFSYVTRNSASNNGYAPQGFIIYCSNDGNGWDEVATLDKEKDNLPVGESKQYQSAIIQLGKAYKYLRFQLTESTRKNYLVLAEFNINKVVPNPDYGKATEDFVPEIIVPAKYENTFMPFGTDYKVHVDFLTDHPTGDNSKYSVPRIDITFGNGTTWDYNNWIGRYGKEQWEEATIKIDGVGVFDDMEESSILVRGRGNSSWSQSSSSKNPYRIKFSEKMKPFGLTKGKNWVLLANKQSGSLTTNAIAMKIADMAESAACNHIIPVELYVNNQYRGSYNFTEKVGFASNSIALDDESNAVLLELDSYYDEAHRFKSSPYNQPVNIKQPDFDDPETITNLTYDDIRTAFNAFTSATLVGEHDAYLDVDAFCRAMLVTDLTRNTELQHPKSWNVYNADILNDSAWVFGPVWDFDWSYGYEGHSQYFIYEAETDIFNYGNNGIPFFRQLLRGNDVIKKHYYKVWTDFLNAGKLDELLEFCDDYYAYVQPSFVHNSTMWGDGNGYNATTERSKTWLAKRANYIYTHLDRYDTEDGEGGSTPPDLEGEDIGSPDRINLTAVLSEPVDVFTLGGVRLRSQVPYRDATRNLMPGIYVIKGKKVVIK